MAYVNFDSLMARFQGQIYNTRKGRLRMYLIDALYQQALPMSQLPEWSVLDAGGGLGQMSHWFLEQGAGSVSYFDVSQRMVSAASQSLDDYLQAGRLELSQASVTEYQPESRFDFVNVHAVLEWLESPLEVLSDMLTWVRPGGYIGLMVYNRHMLMLRHLMRGTLDRAMSGNIGGDKRGLTPVSPLNPQEVAGLLQAQGFEILTQAGIRSFSDLTEQTVLDWYSEESLFNAELTLCEQRPYCDLGRYVLFLARRPEFGCEAEKS